ncbi:hypothetical protein [Arcanobacterium phocae]|uniref:hypothetical protein n=1 Tax=Arcanobacterium phocae TaxID=131112 RepID=UPI001C0F1733|nr:hypothetical protein [Arcanobacterium phocae]
MDREEIEDIFTAVKIEGIQFADLLNAEITDRIMVSKAGGYLGQSLETILRTKIYDLKNNTQEILGASGVDHKKPLCFWAFRKNGKNSVEQIRKHFESSSAKSKTRWVILPITNSSGKERELDLDLEVRLGDDLEERCAEIKELKDELVNNKEKSQGDKNCPLIAQKVQGKPYPEKMFPELSDGDGYAFVVSGLWKTNESFKKVKVHKDSWKQGYFQYVFRLWKEYESVTKSGESTPGEYSVVGNNTNVLLQRKCEKSSNNVKKKSCIDVKDIFDYAHDSDGVPCLVAQIEYPYVVELTV